MIRKLARSIREYKKEAILTGVFITIEVVMEVLIPIIMAYLLDSGINKGNSDVIVKSSIILIIISSISLATGSLASLFSAKASCGFAKNLREDMYFNVQDFSFSNIDKFSSSSIVTRLTTDVSNVQNAYIMVIRTAVRAPLMLLFSLIMVLYISPKMALIYALVVPILGLVLYMISRTAFPLFEKVFHTYDEINNNVQENVRGIRVVKSYVKEEDEKKKFAGISKLIYDRFCKAEKVVSYNGPAMQLTMYTCNILIAWFGTKLIVGGSLNTGELTSLFSYSGSILSSLMMLSMIYVMCTIAVTSATRIVELLDEKSDIVNGNNPIMNVKDGSIEFKNVSFGYKHSDRLSLKDVNLKIKSGEVIGIIGGTGSSKSTLVNLISRLYDVSKGEVCVGGVDVRKYDLKTLRDNVAVVLQKNVLFSGTIIDNMRWGKEDATEEEIIKACELAQASEFIEKLPDKYNYYIEQGGTNVSGGQRQRLCIARALLKNPKILILDDSTSAVDTATDAKIRKLFKQYIPDITKIIIAQRIASISDCDRVIVMDNGKLVAFDTPNNLLKNNAIYQEVYYSQTKGDDDDGR